MKEQNLWYPYAQMKLIGENYLVDSAKGVYLNLNTGEKLIDGISSWWCAMHGYNNDEINNTAIEQLNKVSHIMLGGLRHKPAEDLAEKLVEISPKGLNHVFFSDSGSVGVEVALKMAIQYFSNQGLNKKNRIVSLEKSYHGDTFKAMEVGGDMCYHKAFSSIFPERLVIKEPSNFDASKEDVEKTLEILENCLKDNSEEVAAFILEPIVQCSGGFNIYSPYYLKGAKKLCKKYNVLLIFDEVATGFGRTGKFFAAEHADLCPDIMVIGKAMTGGYVGHAGTLTTTDVFSKFYSDDSSKAFMHGPTFMGNPLSCAIALKSIEIFQRENYLEKVEKIEKTLKEEFKSINSDKIKAKRIIGAIGAIEVYDSEDLKGFQTFAKKRGVWLRPFEEYVYTMPPFIIKKEELLKITRVLKEWFS